MSMLNQKNSARQDMKFEFENLFQKLSEKEFTWQYINTLLHRTQQHISKVQGGSNMTGTICV
jgi:hypothetical protein